MSESDWEWTKRRPYDWSRDDADLTDPPTVSYSGPLTYLVYVLTSTRKQRMGTVSNHVGTHWLLFTKALAKAFYPFGRGFKQ